MNSFEHPEAKKAYYLERLWQKAEELSVLRRRLQAELDTLFKRIEAGDVGAIGLAAKEKLVHLHGQYREIEEAISEVKTQENDLQKAIEAVDEGAMDEELLISLIGQEEGPKLSKRKRRILEEQEKDRQREKERYPGLESELDLPPIDPHLYKATQRGPGSNKLTTGHHGKRLKGNIKLTGSDLKDIEHGFFKATQDTHGGKAKHGKSGKTYVSKSGKNIRKS